MISSLQAEFICRVVVALSVIIIWILFYTDGRLGYDMERGVKRYLLQFSSVLGAIVVFSLQIFLLEHFVPKDAYGAHFAKLVFADWGGGIVVLFTTGLIWRKRKAASKF